MRVLVDSSIWSVALRRDYAFLNDGEREAVDEWTELLRERRAVLIGPVVQEVLSGIKHESQHRILEERILSFPIIAAGEEDYLCAARMFNQCRAHGVTGTAIDLLLCAVAVRLDIPIFTTDADFKRYARHLPVRLHAARQAGKG